MKNINVLLGTLAGAALTVACFEVNAGNNSNGYNGMEANGAATIMMADNSSTMRNDEAEPAMGGENDAAMGGNAPNPEPDRSASTVAEDASITAKVKTKLLADSTVGGLKIDVDTRSGVVYLTGDHMNSQAEINQAVKLTEETAGVKDVESKLKVGDVKK